VGSGSADDELAGHATALAEAAERALPGWVERSVASRMAAFGGQVDADLQAAARRAGAAAAADVGSRLRALLATDVDEQRSNPLSVLRSAVRYPTEVLATAGVPPVVRSAFEERADPGDIYGLAPATWADIDPALHEPGVTWGAAKAFVVLARRRAEGRRQG
jgi:hypothetical protein